MIARFGGTDGAAETGPDGVLFRYCNHTCFLPEGDQVILTKSEVRCVMWRVRALRFDRTLPVCCVRLAMRSVCACVFACALVRMRFCSRFCVCVICRRDGASRFRVCVACGGAGQAALPQAALPQAVPCQAIRFQPSLEGRCAVRGRGRGHPLPSSRASGSSCHG